MIQQVVMMSSILMNIGIRTNNGDLYSMRLTIPLSSIIEQIIFQCMNQIVNGMASLLYALGF